MRYRVLADVVVFAHFLWIIFLVAGAYWGRKHRAVMIVHGAGLAFAIVSQVLGWYCPLTYLEVWLREKQRASPAYPGSFIAHYVEELVYIEVAPAVIFALTLALISANMWIYWRALKKTGEVTR